MYINKDHVRYAYKIKLEKRFKTIDELLIEAISITGLARHYNIKISRTGKFLMNFKGKMKKFKLNEGDSTFMDLKTGENHDYFSFVNELDNQFRGFYTSEEDVKLKVRSLLIHKYIPTRDYESVVALANYWHKDRRKWMSVSGDPIFYQCNDDERDTEFEEDDEDEDEDRYTKKSFDINDPKIYEGQGEIAEINNLPARYREDAEESHNYYDC